MLFKFAPALRSTLTSKDVTVSQKLSWTVVGNSAHFSNRHRNHGNININLEWSWGGRGPCASPAADSDEFLENYSLSDPKRRTANFLNQALSLWLDINGKPSWIFSDSTTRMTDVRFCQRERLLNIFGRRLMYVSLSRPFAKQAHVLLLSGDGVGAV